MVQITSSRGPFRNAGIASRAASVVGRADAMGLLPARERIDTLDMASLRRVVKHVHKAGIGRAIQVVDEYDDANQSPALEHLLDQLGAAMEESPAPQFEWNRLAAILGMDLLAALLGLSASSTRRYREGVRATPDEVAERLHLLTLTVGDLSGAYNEIGIRRWFDRKRTQLDGHAPRELLAGAWNPRAEGPERVRELARAFSASPAT